LRRSIIAVIAGAGILLVLALLKPGPLWHRSLPDFAAIDSIPERKSAFFEFLKPYVDEANEAVERDRQRLGVLQRRLVNGPLGRRDACWLQEFAEEYNLASQRSRKVQEAIVQELLMRVDIVPPSLALAQAALESGWGTSRFAREGNNLFGIWCYKPGCGIVPKHRPVGASYEVARYKSPEKSFLAYMQTLNGNTAYREMWLLRNDLRENGDEINGAILAGGLYRYSQEGDRYIAKVRGLIRANNLHELDK
jgi:Bax protein